MKVTIEGTPEEIQTLMKKEPHGGEVLFQDKKKFEEFLFQSFTKALASTSKIKAWSSEQNQIALRKKEVSKHENRI